MIEPTDIVPVRYEHSTFDLAPIKDVTPQRRSGLPLLIGGLLAIGYALAHLGNATQAESVAWAFVVAAIIAALNKWA